MEDENENEIINDNFQLCVRKINNMRINNEINYKDFIKIYGHYKQALFGDNKDVIPPYWFHFHYVRKWKSWKDNSGKTKNDAKSDYVTATSFLENKVSIY